MNLVPLNNKVVLSWLICPVLFFLYICNNTIRYDSIFFNSYYIITSFNPANLLRVWFDLFVFTSLVVLALGLGRLILYFLDIPLFLSKLSACMLLGMGAVSVAFMVLVFLHQLHFQSILSLILVLFVISGFGLFIYAKELIDWFHKPYCFREKLKTYFLPGVAITFACWIAFWSSLLPPTQSDALRYHLTVPDLYIRHGGFVELPTLSFSNFPFLIEYLFLFPMSFGSICGPKLIHCLFFLITLVQVSHLANHWGGRRAGVLAALLVASTPFVPIFASWAFIEFGLSAYTLFAVQCAMAVRSAFVEGERSKAWRWAILFGIVAGLLLGCKYTALATVAILGLAMLWPGRGAKLTLVQRLPIATLGVMLALLIASPWYIKNVILFSNPVFPFGGSVFPTHEWSEFNQSFFSYHAGMKGSLNAVRQSSLIEKVVDFITLPFRTTLYSSDVYKIENFGDMPTGVLWLVGALLAAFHRQWRAGMAFLGGMSLFLFIFWGQTYRDIRFLLPCLVTAAPLLGVIWSDLIDRSGSIKWFIASAVIYNLLTTHGLTLIPGTYMPWMVASGKVDRETYLLQVSDETRYQNQAFHYLEENTTPQTRVLLHGIQEPYYCKNNYVWSDWFNTDILISWSWQAPSADALLERVQDEGIDYLVWNYGNMNQYNQTYLPYYRLFRLPRETGLPLLREYISKEYARIHYPYEYSFWIKEFVHRLDQAEVVSPNVAALETLLRGGMLEEVFRFDEKPQDPFHGIVIYRVPTKQSHAE